MKTTNENTQIPGINAEELSNKREQLDRKDPQSNERIEELEKLCQKMDSMAQEFSVMATECRRMVRIFKLAEHPHPISAIPWVPACNLAWPIQPPYDFSLEPHDNDPATDPPIFLPLSPKFGERLAQ